MNFLRHRLMNLPRHRLLKSRYCTVVGFTWQHSTQAEVLCELPAFWKSFEVKVSTSDHNASWTAVGSTSPSTSPLRHLISITSLCPFFPHCLHIGLVLLLGIKLGSLLYLFMFYMYMCMSFSYVSCYIYVYVSFIIGLLK
ncbi:hypothetical protein E2C01_102149 [Portunus trituberculatus]|uniref:Uncharacterized protein n=1 Tax=Portunus trituberculatus TaxID=210409 RepID=A0A5B7KCE2_PORTR|nr:hypothetical protein [Portunus trituberculatus]